jgi:5'-nucleotidase
MTRILVTNDDGVDAPGIRALAEAAHAGGHDVVVAAPRAEASGMSAALTAVTAEGRVVVERRVGPVEAYAVAASPAYIAVLAALGVFGEPPEVLLSGINRGANAGNAVLHSGTVGAALTAANNGVRAMAVSLDVLNPVAATAASGGAATIVLPDDADLHWDTAARMARDLIGWLAAAPPRTVLNLNVPDRPVADVAGLREATLAPFGQVRMAVAETGEDFVRLTVEREGEQLIEGSDLAWLAAGYAAATVIRPPAEVPGVHLPAQRTAMLG